jgi:hypothetical protein
LYGYGAIFLILFIRMLSGLVPLLLPPEVVYRH